MVRIIERLSHFVGVIAAWLIVPLVFASVYEVVARYVFNAPTIWAYEIGYLMTGSGFLLGMAYALSRDAHIRIDVFSVNMTQRTKAIIDIVCYVGLLLPFPSVVDVCPVETGDASDRVGREIRPVGVESSGVAVPHRLPRRLRAADPSGPR